VIVFLNILVFLGVIFFGGLESKREALNTAMTMTLFQCGFLLLFGVVLGSLCVVSERARDSLGGLNNAVWLSLGTILLISAPVCLGLLG
jgi:hypothetical protein